jgi:ribonuclease T2
MKPPISPARRNSWPETKGKAMKCWKLVILILAVGVFSAAPSRARAQQYAMPGKFDFYLFTLSWSPQFCATTRRETAECEIHGGNFVVHGLWPEFKNGSWPSNCSSEPGPANPKAQVDIMPDSSLLAHEWQKHGTCSGLGVNGYFDLMRSIRKSITIPDSLLHLKQTQMMAPAEIKAQFVAANSQIKTEDMVIGCANNTLVQVQFCVAKDGTPTACGTIRDCRATKIKVLPVLP